MDSDYSAIIQADGYEGRQVEKIQNKIRDINEKLQILDKQTEAMNYHDVRTDELRKLMEKVSSELVVNISEMHEMQENTERLNLESFKIKRTSSSLSKKMKRVHIKFSRIISGFVSFLRCLLKVVLKFANDATNAMAKGFCSGTCMFMPRFANPTVTEMATFVYAY